MKQLKPENRSKKCEEKHGQKQNSTALFDCVFANFAISKSYLWGLDFPNVSFVRLSLPMVFLKHLCSQNVF